MDYGVSLVLDADRLRWPGGWLGTQGRVALTVAGAHRDQRWHSWQTGRRLRVVATLRGPPFYRNPGGRIEEFIESGRDAAWLGSVKSEHLVETLTRGSWLDEMLGAVRERTRRAIRRAVEDPSTAAILVAILIGDRGAIPHDVEVRLQKAGTYHVIAISGGNIAILVGLLSVGGRLLRAPSHWWSVATIGLVGAYGFVAGGAASVARACLAAVILLAGHWCDVRPRGLPVLWTAVMVLLLWDPLSAFDVGFQLTVLATGAILLAGAIAEADSGSGDTRIRVYALVRSTLVATLAADIAMLPTMVSSFNRVTIAGVVLNLAALPLMGLAQIAGLAIVCANDVWGVGRDAAAVAARFAIGGLLWSARLVDVMPWLSWRVPTPSPWAGAVYLAAWMIWALLRLTRQERGQRQEAPRQRWLVIAQRGVLVLACSCTWGLMTGADAFVARAAAPPAPAARAPTGTPGRGVLTFVFLDVGQGDATFVRFPSGHAWLVDAGGLPGVVSFDVGERVVAPALWALGVRALDVLAVTHPDPDHAGGAPAIASDFRPRALWEGVPVPGHALNERIHDAIPPNQRVVMRRGTRIGVGGVSVTVLHPLAPTWTRVKVRNDDSLVLEFRFGSVRVVLPGDISAVVERELAQLMPTRGATLTILKLPHHGSAGSSSAEFIRALAPALAVISSGRGNRFGHPAPAVLDRLALVRVPTVRTSELGAIALNTDGRHALASAWTGRDWRPVWQGAELGSTGLVP